MTLVLQFHLCVAGVSVHWSQTCFKLGRLSDRLTAQAQEMQPLPSFHAVKNNGCIWMSERREITCEMCHFFPHQLVIRTNNLCSSLTQLLRAASSLLWFNWTVPLLIVAALSLLFVPNWVCSLWYVGFDSCDSRSSPLWGRRGLMSDIIRSSKKTLNDPDLLKHSCLLFTVQVQAAVKI